MSSNKKIIYKPIYLKLAVSTLQFPSKLTYNLEALLYVLFDNLR